MKSYSSHYLGVCLDFGNNVSLLAIAPNSSRGNTGALRHLDIRQGYGLQADADGFLLSEVPLGEGYLDLGRMVSTVRAARPATRFTLEMISRDPLKVSCLAEKYGDLPGS